MKKIYVSHGNIHQETTPVSAFSQALEMAEHLIAVAKEHSLPLTDLMDNNIAPDPELVAGVLEQGKTICVGADDVIEIAKSVQLAL